jgi:Glycosyl hydrolases family 16
MRRMGQMRQKSTDGAPRTRVRDKWSARRSLVGVGALAALAALAACSGSVANSASHATAAVTEPGTAAIDRNAQSPAPATISRAIAHGRTVQPTRKASPKPAKQPKTTNPMAVARPGMTPTPTPTATPLWTPTATPTATPRWTPTATPTETPTAAPTAAPTATPTSSQSGIDPSGQNPVTALSGFTLKYVQEFNADTLPSNWGAYQGVPGGESSQEAQWLPSMCTFSGGEAHFMASGIDSCGMHYQGDPQEYGAWFARLQGSAEPSGELFSDIFLLWPANNQWPPEIDIYEDEGNRSRTVATLWNTVGNACGSSPTSQCLGQYQQGNGEGDGVANTDTEWHTYGLEWTPSGVSWLIDGHVILTAPASAVKSPAQQPALPMNLDLQSQNLQGSPGTPSLRETMTVDWVQQFSWNG